MKKRYFPYTTGTKTLGTVIRCIVVLFFVCIAQMKNEIYAQEKKYSFKVQNVSLKEGIKQLEDISDFHFFFKSEEDEMKKNVNLEFEESDIYQILDKLITGTNLSYKVEDKYIAMINKEDVDSQNDETQDNPINSSFNITGKVSDDNGLPLPGVSIVEQGTSTGTISRSDGGYTITVSSENATLLFSFIGMQTKTIPISGRTTLDAVMQTENSELDEIVVVGYGSLSKGKVLGSISKVGGEDIEKYATSSFEQALQGTMAGVQVTQGRAGEDSKITIRGIGTLTAGTNPLIVVDGVPLTEGSSLSSINPNDIKSVSVLKDAASAAIYGSRAANGVLLITTKRGKVGDLKVTVSAYTGMQYGKPTIEMVDAYDDALVFKEARDRSYVTKNGGNENDDVPTRIANGAGARQLRLAYTQPYLDGVEGLTNTNWIDEIYNPSQTTNYYTSLSGGTEKTSYHISMGLLNQDGIVIGVGSDKATSNIRINSNLSEKLKFNITLNTSYSKADVTGNKAPWDFPPSIGAGFVLQYPFFPVKNSDGTYALGNQLYANKPEDGALAENVIAMHVLADNTENKFRTFGSTFLEYEVIEGLKLKTLLGGDYRNDVYNFFHPSGIGQYRKNPEDNVADATETRITVENILTETTANYVKDIGDQHLDILGGYSFQQENYNRVKIDANDIPFDTRRNIAGGTTWTDDSKKETWTQVSYFGRIQYDISSKYLASASLRTDGSSRFGDDSKWGTFKSASLGWLLSEEPFFPKNDILNSTKLRVSWGETGNNQIGAYGSKGLIGGYNYNVGDNLIPGYASETAPNPNLSWETSVSTNIGLDLGLFDNKISLSTEYYKTNTKDLLLEVPVPQHSGYSISLQNIGEVQNSGLEFELRGQGYEVGDLTIGFNANLSTNKSEVLALGPDQDEIVKSRYVQYTTKIGGPLADIYSYKTIGIYKTDAQIANSVHYEGTETGDYIIADTDGDGEITTKDKVSQGTYAPDFTYAFGMNFKFKNFDFNFLFDGVEGRKVVSEAFERSARGEAFSSANTHYFENRYHPQNNPDGIYAQPNMNSSKARSFLSESLDVYAQDGDYLRLRTVQLGYNFDKNALEKAKISKLRLYLSANNLFTSTKFIGINPESSINDPLQQGRLIWSEPVPTTILAGLNITF